MSLLGKKFPAPVAKPMAPFFAAVPESNEDFAAGVVILYGVNSLANALMNTEEFKNDPRNPNAKNVKH
ncbi:ATP synthase j chain-domain-containing protein [Aspergillus fumigatus]